MNNPLVGKTVVSVEITTDDQALRFTCSDGTTQVAVCYAECCSHTWIEYVESPENLLGTVRSVEDLTLKPGEDNDDGDYEQFYGCKIYTDKGYCLIDYRNESNGYYGGDLQWGEDKYTPDEDWEWRVLIQQQEV